MFDIKSNQAVYKYRHFALNNTYHYIEYEIEILR